MPGKCYYKIVICVILQIDFLTAGAQQNSKPESSPSEYEAVKYIRNINRLLPQLIEQQKWTELYNYMQNWKDSEAPSDELIFCISTLSAIEQRNWSSFTMPCDFLYFLDDYSRELNDLDTQPAKFRYYIQLGENTCYNASPDCRVLLATTSAWAARLLSDGNLNASEKFLCQVFSGGIPSPGRMFYAKRKSLPELDAFQQQLDTYHLNQLMSLRDKRLCTLSATFGTWIPTRHLGILGAHLSAGYSVGFRKKKNEYDLVEISRFAGSTPQNYTVLRNDTIYTRSYFEGGYLGVEYTRYLVHTLRCDFGPSFGVGYDEFDIASDTDEKFASLSTAISSLNLNTGLRFKYFFHKASFAGLVLKYNFIHYENKGGTDLRGNAFSIDISFGIF